MKKRHEPPLPAGTVLATRLEEGLYGAVRVLRVARRLPKGPFSYLVICTEYMDKQPPRLDDPALKRIVQRRRFFIEGQRSLQWVEGPPPGDWINLGCLDPSNEELAIDPMGAVGGWNLCEDVRLEWRWEHDREALEHEYQVARMLEEQKGSAAFQPDDEGAHVAPMDESRFWKLIDRIDNKASEEDSVKPLIEALGELPKAEMFAFKERLCERLYLLDGRRFAENSGANAGSADAFLYARSFVVSRGREFYERVLHDPTAFPKTLEEWCEPLLYAAHRAYEEKFGEPFDYSAKHDMETGGNARGWEEA